MKIKYLYKDNKTETNQKKKTQLQIALNIYNIYIIKN